MILSQEYRIFEDGHFQVPTFRPHLDLKVHNFKLLFVLSKHPHMYSKWEYDAEIWGRVAHSKILKKSLLTSMRTCPWGSPWRWPRGRPRSAPSCPTAQPRQTRSGSAAGGAASPEMVNFEGDNCVRAVVIHDSNSWLRLKITLFNELWVADSILYWIDSFLQAT